MVNVGDIARVFPEGGSVGVEELVAKGLVRKNVLVKVLGDGKLTAKVDVTAHKFSGSACEPSPPRADRPPSCNSANAPVENPAMRGFRVSGSGLLSDTEYVTEQRLSHTSSRGSLNR